ncbi:MAG: glycosyltransferase [Pseudomonadota bacterium]
MKKILFIVIPENGHINPYIGVAKHLQEKGFNVGFYSMHDISTQLLAADLNCFVGEFIAPPQYSKNHGKQFAANVKDAQWLRSWIKELLIDGAEGGIANIKKVLDSFNPDLVITDPMIYSAAIAATLKKVKWVAISNSLNPVIHAEIKSELLNTVQWLDPFRKKLFQDYGMDIQCSGCDMLSPYLNIAFVTEELVGCGHTKVNLVGPSIPQGRRGDEQPFDWKPLATEVPIIYMSFGSQIYYQPEMFKIVFAAVRNQPIQLIAVVNELMLSDELGSIPVNVILTHYAPQLQLLPKASVMITHGGANSVMEAIYYGIPMLISPICNDQFHQGFFIERNNIGVQLDLNNATVEQCRNVLNRLLRSAVIHNNMARISQSYQKDGALNAANIIADFIARDEQH